MSDVVYRPLRDAGEFQLFNRYAAMPTSGVGRRSRTFDEFVAAGDYRPEWTWIAVRKGEVIARAAFWAPPGHPHPFGLDWFDPGAGPDRVDIGAQLLRAAYSNVVTSDYSAPPHPDGGRPAYQLFLPADWHDRPDATADATDRIQAAERAGMIFSKERINVRWTPADGLPKPSGRLSFVPATSDADMLAVLERVRADSLDVDDQRHVRTVGAAEAAGRTLTELAAMPGGRARWRLALDSAGDVVGIVLPTRNPSSATIGYLGVVPAHRGRHYVDDLVAEALSQFAADEEPVVNDATDAANEPMADAFNRCGYRVTGRQVIMI